MDVCCDICVIGAGPAGLTSAIELQRIGFDVLLVERHGFPRHRVGESLSPGAVELLMELGVNLLSHAQRHVVHSRSATVCWESPPFFKRRRLPSHGAVQVDRGWLDLELLKIARASGVRVLQPVEVVRASHRGELHWRLAITKDSESVLVETKFVVDASGRKFALAKKRRLMGPPLVGIYGYAKAQFARGHDIVVEAGEDCWYWGAPIPNGRYCTMVFESIGTLINRSVGKTANANESLSHHFMRRIAGSHLLSHMADHVLDNTISACRAGSSLAEEPVTCDSLSIGDAAYSLDPISGQGVQAAIASGFYSKPVVNTLLNSPERANLVIQFVEDQQRRAVEGHSRNASGIYANHQTWRDRAFWQDRSVSVFHGKGQYSPEDSQNEVMHDIYASDLNSLSTVSLSPELRFDVALGVCGDLIDSLPVIVHPALNQPVSYLGKSSFPIATKLRELTQVPKYFNIGALLRSWESNSTREASRQAIMWCISKGVLQTHSES